MKTKLLYNRTIIKVIACILGYSLWTIASSSQILDLWLTVPVCFYNTSDKAAIDCQEEINIHVLGSRAALQQSKRTDIAAHIDAQHLHEGTNIIALSSNMLLLPPAVRLRGHTPACIKVAVSNG